MAHIHRHEDSRGDLVELTYFCSDFCHQDWCTDTGTTYEGWDGCHEIYSPAVCASCEEKLSYFDEEQNEFVSR